MSLVVVLPTEPVMPTMVNGVSNARRRSDVVLRQGSQGGHRVRHDDLRHRGVHLMRHQRHGGAALRGAPHEVVAIHPFPGDGDEDASLTDPRGNR